MNPSLELLRERQARLTAQLELFQLKAQVLHWQFQDAQKELELVNTQVVELEQQNGRGKAVAHSEELVGASSQRAGGDDVAPGHSG